MSIFLAMKAETKVAAGGIDLEVRALSKAQLEFGAKFRLKGRDPFELPESYAIDTYFVLPARMHLSPASYPIDTFYQDFAAVLRLREPKIFYKTYFSRQGSYHNSPLFQIEQFLADTGQGRRFDNADYYEREVKMFALSFERYVQKRTERAAAIIARRSFTEESAKELKDSQAFVERYDYFRRVLKVFRYWRRVVARADELPDDLLADLQDTIRFADEFCLKVFLRAVLKLLSTLQNSTFPDGALYASTERRLIAYHRLIAATCRQSGYIIATGDDSIHVREQMLFHFGWLKRRINAALYLNLRTKPLFSFQQQVGAMAAAAIAGAWAGLLGLLMEGSLVGRGLLGQNAAIIVLALTLGYVLKDRIKELGRDRFKNFFNLLPDHVNEITYAGDGRDARPLTIGEISETAYYTEKTDDKAIQDFFKTYYIDLAGKRGEKKLVIRYMQSYVPNPRTIAELPPSMDHLHETMRYDIASLVAKLDSPFQDTLRLKDGKVEKVVTPKNYSIGLVLKLTAGAAEPKLVTLKVVINRSGIQRIEPLSRGDTF